MVVGNGRIPTYETLNQIPNTKVSTIEVTLPEWFRTSQGKKFIKIYGTQLYCIVQDTDNEKYKYDVDTPLEATIHCNLARDANTRTLAEPYVNVPESKGSNELINEVYDGYVSTVNNFYTPKVYEYKYPAMIDLCFWFKNKHGSKIPIFYVQDSDTEDIDVCFLLFKIEYELITV
jgi:hypothetical protein